MVKSYVVYIVLMFQVSLSCMAQKVPCGSLDTYYRKVQGSYNFWLYKPQDYTPSGHSFPLIIFLHGASLCGTNLNKVLKYGVIDAIIKGKRIPAVVLTPQNNGGAWSPQKLNMLLEWTLKNCNIDETRVYVLGMSLGGYGTMDFAGTYPEKIAAAMALCGGCYLKNWDGLAKLPLWIMHGTADKAVAVSESKKVVNYLLKNTDAKLLRYDWFPNGSHSELAKLFYLQKTYDWLFAHSTSQNPKDVERNFNIGREDFKQINEQLRWFRGIPNYD